MSKNVAMVTKSVRTSAAFQHIIALCAEHGIDIVADGCQINYIAKWRAAENVITWGVKWKNSMYSRGSRNVMFLENGLLSQRANFYIDTEGYFDGSTIVRSKEYNHPYTGKEIARVAEIANKRFHWEMGKYEHDHKAPILVCMQMNGDASVRHCFPAAKEAKSSKRNKLFLEILKENNIKGTKYIIRGHPRERGDRRTPEIEGGYPDNWIVDNSGSLYDVIPRCQAMISINSTCVTEATTYGMPVAVFGRSTFTGSSGVVLDCSKNHDKVQELLHYRPNMESVHRYVCAVMRHQIAFDDTMSSVVSNDSVRKFIARTLDKTYNGKVEHKVKVCVYCAYSNPASKCSSCNGKSKCRRCGKIL